MVVGCDVVAGVAFCNVGWALGGFLKWIGAKLVELAIMSRTSTVLDS